MSKLQAFTKYTLARQLASVRRYSRDFSVAPESVLEHIGFCALYCLSTARKVEQHMGKDFIDYGNLLSRAILHDIEEAETGDINRRAKYFSPGTKEALSSFEQMAARSICHSLFPDLYEEWRDAKDNTIEGIIVKLSDLAAVAYHVHNEMYVLNNKSFLNVQQEAFSFIEAFIAEKPYDSGLSFELSTFLRNELYCIQAILLGSEAP